MSDVVCFESWSIVLVVDGTGVCGMFDGVGVLHTGMPVQVVVLSGDMRYPSKVI